LNVRIREPGIFELADIESELFNHGIQARNTQIYIRLSGVDMIVAVTVIPEKEI
jgi:hypothetical protein